MRCVRALTFGAALALSLGLVAGCGSSSKSSSSSSPTTESGVTVPSTPSGTTVDVVVSDKTGVSGPMTLVATPDTAPAGDVTFKVTNNGTIDHEVVVLKTNVAYDKLPITTYDGEPNRVDESSSVGETGDPALKPGETRSFTVKNMEAGKYVLLCNLSKHYEMGMRAPFVVT